MIRRKIYYFELDPTHHQSFTHSYKLIKYEYKIISFFLKSLAYNFLSNNTMNQDFELIIPNDNTQIYKKNNFSYLDQ